MKNRQKRMTWLMAFASLGGLAQTGGDSTLRNIYEGTIGNQSRIQVALARLPIYFEASGSQSSSQVKYLARGNRSALFLTEQEAILSLGENRDPASFIEIGMRFAGANPAPAIEGMEELPGRSNYFSGNDPARWRTNIPHYAKVRYAEVYPGIDLIFYGTQGHLEYDFVVAPGADLNRIRLEFAGITRMAVDRSGNLILEAGERQIIQRAPAIYQEIGGIRKPVAGGYWIRPDRQVGFQAADYDAGKPLILDPVLEYSRFFGGSQDEEIISVAVDGAGNTYLAGESSSPDLPTSPNALSRPASVSGAGSHNSGSAAFVAKLNAKGTALVYCTYLVGSKTSVAHSLKIDAQGNAYVVGRTEADDFPTVKPFQPAFAGEPDDGFVAKLNPSGSALVFSTYLGGKKYDEPRNVAVDGSGNVYVTGITESDDFPTRNSIQAKHAGGKQDLFVAKLNAAGSALVYSTYLGGSGNDVGHAIAADSAGNAYITGITNSPNFPTRNPIQAMFRTGKGNDSIVVKINPSGSALVYSTYLGGSKNDESRGIVVDAAGNAYITGYTESDDFPTAKPLQAKFAGGANDIFVTELNSQGSALAFSTFLGGSGGDNGRALALDSTGNIYVTGLTDSKDFPMKNPFQEKYAGGTADAFVEKISAGGSSLVYSTYLGGSGYERGRGIAADASGNVFVTGQTESQDFPTTKSLSPKFAGGKTDAFVVKIIDQEK